MPTFTGPWITPPAAPFTAIMTTTAAGQVPAGIPELGRRVASAADFNTARETESLSMFTNPAGGRFDNDVHVYGGVDGAGHAAFEVEQLDFNLDFNIVQGLDFADPTFPPHAVAIEHQQADAPVASRLPWIIGPDVALSMTLATNPHHPVVWTADGTTTRNDEGLTLQAATGQLYGTPNFAFPHATAWIGGVELAAATLLAQATIAATYGGSVTFAGTIPVALLPIAANWPGIDVEIIGGDVAPLPLYPYVQVTVAIDRQVTGVAPGTDPPVPPAGVFAPNPLWFAKGAQLVVSPDAALAVQLSGTYQPPPYRFVYDHAPPLRQYPRDDALGGTPRQGHSSRSVQASTREGWAGTYR